MEPRLKSYDTVCSLLCREVDYLLVACDDVCLGLFDAAACCGALRQRTHG